MGSIERIQIPAAAEDTSGQRAEARALSERVAKELQRAARNARTRHRPLVLRARDLTTLMPSLPISRFAQPVRLSFIALVAVPAIAAGLYFGVIAANQYEAEARFAVRTGAISGIDALTSLSGLPSVNQVQDSLIVANFVRSRAAVEALERRIGLRERFTRTGADLLSRLAADAPIEDLVSFWERKVGVSIESPSGIVTVSVRAFTPEDAHAIAEALIAESEELVNRLGVRAREDLVANSERELERAEARLREARETLAKLRNAEGIIDPQLTAQGLNMLIGELRAEVARVEQEIATLQRTVSRDAPQIGLLRARLDVLREQIAELQSELTSRRTGDRVPLSEVMTRFDQLALERQILERQYAMAATALEQARASATRQQMYLATFVRPVLPEDPVAPRRILYPLLIAAGLLALWAIGLSTLLRLRWRNG